MRERMRGNVWEKAERREKDWTRERESERENLLSLYTYTESQYSINGKLYTNRHNFHLA